MYSETTNERKNVNKIMNLFTSVLCYDDKVYSLNINIYIKCRRFIPPFSREEYRTYDESKPGELGVVLLAH